MRRSRENARSEHFRGKSHSDEAVADRNTDTDIDAETYLRKDEDEEADGSALQGQDADVPEPLRHSKVGARAPTVDTRAQQPHAAEARVLGARAKGKETRLRRAPHPRR